MMGPHSPPIRLPSRCLPTPISRPSTIFLPPSRSPFSPLLFLSFCPFVPPPSRLPPAPILTSLSGISPAFLPLRGFQNGVAGRRRVSARRRRGRSRALPPCPFHGFMVVPRHETGPPSSRTKAPLAPDVGNALILRERPKRLRARAGRPRARRRVPRRGSRRGPGRR